MPKGGIRFPMPVNLSVERTRLFGILLRTTRVGTRLSGLTCILFALTAPAVGRILVLNSGDNSPRGVSVTIAVVLQIWRWIAAVVFLVISAIP